LRGFLIENEAAAESRNLVGTLFPQALVATAECYCLLDDVLGPGFSLVVPPGTSVDLLRQVDMAALRKLSIRVIAVMDKEDASTVDGPVMTVRDARGEVAKLLSPYPSGLYLVRPDRYVAGLFTRHQTSTCADDIAKCFATTWECGSAAACSLPFKAGQ